MKKTTLIILLCLCSLLIMAKEHRLQLIVDPAVSSAYPTISSALDAARREYATSGKYTTIRIAPGDYYEELTIDVPGIQLINGAHQPGIGVTHHGVEAAPNAVRISWHCGHGYQYASMQGNFNYGGKRMRRWNATVLVSAPGFYAENIIFENSFNLYISPSEAKDSLVDISQAKTDWTEKERPKRAMPDRPKQIGSTEVQTRFYRERASAISFTSDAKGCTLRDCRVVGRQDAFYGDHGASVYVQGGCLCGAVDYIFGGLTLLVKEAELVAMIGNEHNDHCYISAGRGYAANVYGPAEETEPAAVPADEVVPCGMLFVDCTVRHATTDELANPGNAPIWLGRAWRWWGETIFIDVKAVNGVLQPEGERWSLGLTKGIPSPYCREQNKGKHQLIRRWERTIRAVK